MKGWKPSPGEPNGVGVLPQPVQLPLGLPGYEHQGKRRGLEPFIGESPALLAELENIEAAARYDVTVLIVAETGTGKELVAHAVHGMSKRGGKPLVTYNCSSLAGPLADDKLFGHVRGAFTGADAAAPGLVEEAEGGVLFLDEINSCPKGTQGLLLRLLDNGEFYRVGCAKVRKANVRIIAATNVDLAQPVSEGKFREDLFFRLNLQVLTMPPLRFRKEDIPLLARHFMEKFAHDYGEKGKRLLPEAMAKLLRSDWPGNVRELHNTLVSAWICSKHPWIGAEHVSLKERDASLPPSLAAFLAEQRKTYIQRVVETCGGDVAAATRIAGITSRHFRRLRG